MRSLKARFSNFMVLRILSLHMLRKMVTIMNLFTNVHFTAGHTFGSSFIVI